MSPAETQPQANMVAEQNLPAPPPRIEITQPRVSPPMEVENAAGAARDASASASRALCPATVALSEKEGGQITARRGFLRRSQVD
ncbi:hypothetical protein LA080_013473 [Diaporthe eres]|nr:hypothetical protein LA080_013473 [Diaporthe eres]